MWTPRSESADDESYTRGSFFALAFGLLLSDYMSRQVLSAVFPILKADWDLSDSHLASLSSVVALMVGLFDVPVVAARGPLGAASRA